MPKQDDRILCITFSIDKWNGWNTTDRIRARVSLSGTVGSVCRRVGLRGVEDELCSRDRLVFVLWADPAAVVPGLIRQLIIADPADHGALRMTVAAGMAGARTADQAVAESLRMLDLRPSQQNAPFTVILSDLIYRDALVSEVGRSAFRRFQRLSGEGFAPDSWVWPLRRHPGPAGHESPGVLIKWLGRRADRHIRRGDHAGAIVLLHRLIRRRPLPPALVRLGECHLELGEERAAAEVWRYLIRRRPLDVDTYLLIGSLEPRADLARAYLLEGLRIVRIHPGLFAMSHILVHDLLLELALLSYRQNDRAAGDRFVNEAAEADPRSAKPLLVLAHEATRRGDRTSAQRLQAAAFARTWEPRTISRRSVRRSGEHPNT